MKKILFFVMAAALFCGCKKEDDGEQTTCPVTGVEMPESSADNPIVPGAEVTLHGTGFNQSSEIWLRGSTEAKAKAEQQDTKATVTSVTTSSITFEAPEVYGTQTIVLKQDGGEWNLGAIVFAEQPIAPEPPTETGLLPNKVATVRVTNNDSKGDNITEYVFTYDEQGRIAKLVKTEYGDDVLTTVYTYSDNRIKAEASGGDYIESQKWTYDIADGNATGYEVVTVSGKSGDNIRDVVTLSYDEKGYITTVEATETTGEGDNSWSTGIKEELVFVDGTLQKYTSTNATESEEDVYTFEFELEAGPLNNLNIDIMGIDWIGEYLYTVPAYLLNVGGERSLKLPKAIRGRYIEPETDAKNDEYTNEFEYEMDGDYISVMKIYRDGNLETTVEIDYEK